MSKEQILERIFELRSAQQNCITKEQLKERERMEAEIRSLYAKLDKMG